MHKGLSRKKTTGPYNAIYEVVGWYSVAAIIGAYVLLSFGYVSGQSLPYQLLNASGALGIILHSLYKKDFQPLVLNVIWLLIAAVVLLKIL